MFENYFDSYFDSYKIKDSEGHILPFVTQWDLNHTMVIENKFGFTDPPAVHFCNKRSKEALVVLSELINDNREIAVKIPNLLLTEPFPVFAYVYTHDLDVKFPNDKTISAIYIPLKPRAKPSDFVYVENVGKITADRLRRYLMKRLYWVFRKILIPWYHEEIMAIEFRPYRICDTDEDFGEDIFELGGTGYSDYVLPVATADRLGGVRIGENIDVTTDGIITADSELIAKGSLEEITAAEIETLYNSIMK